MPVATSPSTTLTRQDRCDRCGAQAYVRAVLPGDGLSLHFCGHHFRAHELALVAAGAEIVDERHRIDEHLNTPEA